MRRALLVGAVLLSTAAGQSGEDLNDLDLKDLLELKVTSIQRKEQTLSRSAAAVSVITREDIRRAGVSSVPEALRLAPGLHVGRAGAGVWAIGSRGFNGQFANKLQVLIDGRSVYHPLSSGVFWDTLDLMIEDIDRIEVIRGPGAVMWGANAVSGVINIITRKVQDTLGGFVEAGTGTEDQALTRFRYGHKVSDSVGVRVSGQYARRGSFQTLGETDADWPHNTARGGFRLDWDRSETEQLVFWGDMFTSGYRELYLAPQPGFGPPVRQAADWTGSGGSLLSRWSRQMLRGQTTAHMYYALLDHGRTDRISARAQTFEIDAQHRMPLSRRHELLVALQYRTTKDRTTGDILANFDPPSRRYNIAAATVQHEFQIVPDRLFLTGGARLEHGSFNGWNVQPTLRLLWAQTPKRSFWSAVSRAVRTASRVEQDLGLVIDVLPTPAGSLITRKAPAPGFRPETLRSYESGFRQGIGSRVSLDASLFYNRYNDLEALVNGPMYFDPAARSLAMDIRSANLASAAGYGAEVAVRADLTYRWRITASTTNYRSRMTTPLAPEAGSAKPDIFPRRQFQLLSTYNVTRRTQFNTIWYHTGATPPAQQVPAHNRLDFGIRWRASEWAGLAFGVQNAFNHSLLDYRPEDGASPQYMRRTAYVRLQWWF